MRWIARSCAVCVTALSLAGAARLEAANVVGTSVRVAWSPASGPVAGYAVLVSRGGPYLEVSRVASTSARVVGQIGETIRVSVVAFDAGGRSGPLSAPSDAITFVAPPPGVALADLDGNGLADDLAVNPATGTIAAALLRSDGSREWILVGAPRDPAMRPAGFADVDGDGRADLLFHDAANGANELWLMRGLTYSVVALPAQAARFGLAAFRDFTGDGRADAFFHDRATGESVLWQLTGEGLRAALAVDRAPLGADLAAVADVDGDRAPDLVWRQAESRALEGWLMRGVTPRAVVSLGYALPNARVAGVGDLDANGVDDLVWLVQSSSATELQVWFLAGASSPRVGLALRLSSTSRLRGVADLNSDGRDDLVVRSSTGSVGYAVTPELAVTTPPQWRVQTLPLAGVPAGNWRFLPLD